MERQTAVSIAGDVFYINGKITHPGRFYNGHKIEGLLLNSRMVQGISTIEIQRPSADGYIPTQANGTRKGTPESFLRQSPNGGLTACCRLQSISKAAVPKDTRRNSRGTIRESKPMAA